MKEKLVHNVDYVECIYIMITALIACVLVLLVPYTFGSVGITTGFSHLPSIGTGNLTNTDTAILEGFGILLSLDRQGVEIIKLVLDADFIIFLGVMLFDIIAGGLLLAFRHHVLRKIFKTISIICGFLLMLVVLIGLLHFVGIVIAFITNAYSIENILSVIDTCGMLSIIALQIASSLLIKWQFKWFRTAW